MTKPLYYQDAYIKEFSAQVVDVESTNDVFRVALDQTAFYPGGGQPCDFGWLTADDTDFAVTRVKKEGDLIWHWLEVQPEDGTDGGEPAIMTESVVVGMTVQGKLDWARRHLLMRTHTSMHILCGIAWRDYQAKATGSTMDVATGRIDFEFESLTAEMIGEIDAKCNAEIAAERLITSQILPRDEAYQIPDLIGTKTNLLPDNIKEIRIVDIEGLDLQADGGTHVNNTREVGRISVVKYKSKGKINKRIYMEIGDG